MLFLFCFSQINLSIHRSNSLLSWFGQKCVSGWVSSWYSNFSFCFNPGPQNMKCERCGGWITSSGESSSKLCLINRLTTFSANLPDKTWIKHNIAAEIFSQRTKLFDDIGTSKQEWISVLSPSWACSMSSSRYCDTCTSASLLVLLDKIEGGNCELQSLFKNLFLSDSMNSHVKKPEMMCQTRLIVQNQIVQNQRLRGLPDSGPQKSPILFAISPLKTLKISYFVARLRRVWDPKKERFPSRNPQNSLNFRAPSARF